MSESTKFRKIGDPLGAGAFGQTFLVEVIDPKLRRQYKSDHVVIKVPLNKEKEETLINEMMTNARLTASLESVDEKHVVKWLGFNTYDGMYVMVMEFIDGKDLRKVMATWLQESAFQDQEHFKSNEYFKGRIDKALKITKDICNGLSTIHNSKILHRDIKPENILIPKKGNAKIADLGVSAIVSSKERASTTAGTIYYMAPEILFDNQGGFYSDVYSTGVLLYEMVTGKLPFYGESFGAITKNIERGKPILPMMINKAVDQRLNDIILKAMNRNIDNRYASAGDLLSAIEQYEKGENPEIAQEEECIRESIAMDESGRKDESIEHLKQLIKKKPKASKAYRHLGELYNKYLQEDKAINIFKEGIKNNPECGLLNRDLALVYFKQQMLDKAIENINAAIEKKLDPKSEKHAKMLRNVIAAKIGNG